MKIQDLMFREQTETKLYHATPAENLPSIRRKGLVPGIQTYGAQNGVYVSDDASVAANYSGFDPEKKWVLLTIDGSQLDSSKFGPDDYELQDVLDNIDEEDAIERYGSDRWSDFSAEQSMRLVNQAVYNGVIPPSAIIDSEPLK